MADIYTSQPQAVVFDLDGTILDSFSVHLETYRLETYRTTCAHFGITITKETFRAAYSADWNRTYGALGILPHDWAAASKLWRAVASKQHAELFPGVKDVLLELRQIRKLALVTSGSKARVARDLENTGIARLFDIVVTGEGDRMFAH